MNTTHHRRGRVARHLPAARRALSVGLKTIALVSLVRQIGMKRAGRAAGVLAGAYLTDLARRPRARRR